MMLGSSCSPCCDLCSDFTLTVPFSIQGRIRDWFVTSDEPCRSIILQRPVFQSQDQYSVSLTCIGTLNANPSGGIPYSSASWQGVPVSDTVNVGDRVGLSAECRNYQGSKYFDFGFGVAFPQIIIDGELFFNNVVGIPDFIGFPYGSAEPTNFLTLPGLSEQAIATMASGGWFGMTLYWYDPNVSQSCWGRAGAVLQFYWPGLHNAPQVGACRRPSANHASGFQCAETSVCECARLARVFPSLGYEFLGVGSSCNPLP